MYVVGYGKSTLKVAGDIRKSGDKVPEAENWKPHVLQAHISMKYLMTEEEYVGWRKQADAHDAALKKRKVKMLQERMEFERSQALGKEAKAKDEQTPEKTEVKTQVEEVKTEERVEEPAGQEEAPKQGLDDLSKSQLKKLAKQKELPVRGSKKELIDRIQEKAEQ